MIRSKLIAWVAAAALAGPGVGRASGPPSPPVDHPPLVLLEGQQLQLAGGTSVTVPPEGGLYLDPPAFHYQTELRRWYELELEVCKADVDGRAPGGWKPWAFAGAGGVLVGLVVGALAARGTR